MQRTELAPSLITLQGPRLVTEVSNAIRNFNLTVPVFHPCHWVPSDGIISIRQLLTPGAQPYLAIKVQGNTVLSQLQMEVTYDIQLVHLFQF